MTGSTIEASRDRLTQVDRTLGELRDDKRTKVKAQTAAKDALAAAGPIDPNSAAFRKAQAATDAVRAVEAQIEQAQAEQIDLLKRIDGTTSGSLSTGSDPRARELTAEPGRWLSAVLGKTAATLPSLPDDRRISAAKSAYQPTMSMASMHAETLGTDSYSSIAMADAAIDLFSPSSVAIASGIGTLRIDTTKTRVPRFTSLPVAEWIAELAPFPKNGPGVEMVDVTPPKVGLVAGLSLESSTTSRRWRSAWSRPTSCGPSRWPTTRASCSGPAMTTSRSGSPSRTRSWSRRVTSPTCRCSPARSAS